LSKVKQILEAINAQVDAIQLNNLSLPEQIQEDLDNAANLLTRSIQKAAKTAIPKSRYCERSKP
jgi:nicotinate-nucleotide pyrophosphorylase